MGAAVPATRCCSATTDATTRSRCSGSTTACTPPRWCQPWDATVFEFAIISLSQYNTRHYLIPPALGVDIRVLNGYMFLTPVGVADPAEIEARVPQFMERAGYYFAELGPAVRRPGCPRCGRSSTSSRRSTISAAAGEGGPGGHHRGPRLRQRLRADRRRTTGCVDLTLKLWNYHFEFLNLGYAAYLDFFGFCKGVFPSIPDQAIAKMVAGIEVDLFRPDEELKRLATLAVDLDLADAVIVAARSTRRWPPSRSTRAGEQWLAEWEEAQGAVVQLLLGHRASTARTRSGWRTSTSRWASSELHRQAQAGEALERPTEAVDERARPHRRRVLRADRQRGGHERPSR